MEHPQYPQHNFLIERPKNEEKMFETHPDNAELLLTFYMSHRDATIALRTTIFEDKMQASDTISEAMGRSFANISLPCWYKGRETSLVINLREVAFVTIDPVLSESDAE